MLYKVLIKYSLFYLVCLAIIAIFFYPLKTQAYVSSRIHVNELKINEISGNMISGEFNVINSEDFYVNNLNYKIQLLLGTSFKELRLIDTTLLDEKLDMEPTGTIKKTFTYNFPKNIISSDYTIRVQIISEIGDELGWDDQIIVLKGENKFLNIISDSQRVLVEGRETLPLQGVAIMPEQIVTTLFKVNNPGDMITVIPQIKIYKRAINMTLVKEYQENPITFTKKESKEINFIMPKFDVPESYLAEIKFYQNNEPVSPMQYFRWVVKGESGKIINIAASKDYYKAGESINLVIDTVGPADFSDAENGILEITVSDKNGNLINKTLVNVALDSNIISSVISIPIDKDLVSPTINVKLIRGDNTLAESNIAFLNPSQGAVELEDKIINDKIISEKRTKTYLLWLISLGILILVLFIGFIIYKKFKVYKG